MTGDELNPKPMVEDESDNNGAATVDDQLLPVSAPSGRARAEEIWQRYAGAPDRLLESIYQYYRGGGYQTLALSRIANLGILSFMLSFLLYLSYGIDYEGMMRREHVGPVSWMEYFCAGPWCVVKRMSVTAWMLAGVMGGAWLWAAAQFWMVERERWQDAQLVYRHLFQIRDRQLSRIDFDEVLRKVVEWNQKRPLVKDLDAVQICARIMRRENYLTALFSKGLLEFTLFGKYKVPLSKPLEWVLTFTVLGYVFDENFMVQRRFLGRQPGDKVNLTEGLRKRVILTGFLSLLLSPLIFVMTLCYLVFRYGEELYRNPKSISARQYTPQARWLLREYNEPPHYFEQRLGCTNKRASKYMNQFYSLRLAAISRLVSFIAGSFLLLLVCLSISKEDLLLHLQLPFKKSILWHIGLLGAILAVSRSFQPEVGTKDDPGRLLDQVLDHLHYRPSNWRDLQSRRCYAEFSELFKLKLAILADDLIGTILTPFALLFILQHRADSLVDFFREFTVHVDGLGYVCSFSVFTFSSNAGTIVGSPVHPSEQPDEKMGMSMMSFAERHLNHPSVVIGDSLEEEDDELPGDRSILTNFYK